MKKVAPKARSFERESPFTMAAMACSRMPKCRFFPAGLSASKSSAPSYVSVVLFDGPRSAEPPRNQGMFCASTFSAWLDASRPAIPLASAGKRGRCGAQPGGRAARGVSPLEPLGIGWKDGKVAVPTGRQFTALHQFDLGRALGVLGAIGGK